MRKNRKFFLIAVPMLLALFALLVFFTLPREPHYNGRSITDWVESYSQGDYTPEGRAQRQVAADAIRQIGTNALPFLLDALNYEPPASKPLFVHLIEKAPTPSRIKTLIYSGQSRRARQRRLECAAVAFQILGEQAAPAVPALTTLLNNTNSWRPHFEAAFALASIGHAGLPPLLEPLTNTSYSDHETILKALGQMNLEAETANVVPAIAGYLDSPNPHWPAMALSVLRNVDTESEDTLRLLLQALRSPHEGTRYWAANLLHRFPKALPQAVPMLQGMTNSSDDTLRSFATSTLAVITEMTNAPAR